MVNELQEIIICETTPAEGINVKHQTRIKTMRTPLVVDLEHSEFVTIVKCVVDENFASAASVCLWMLPTLT